MNPTVSIREHSPTAISFHVVVHPRTVLDAVFHKKEGMWWINRLLVPVSQRKNGYGNALLRAFTDYLDAHQQRAYLKAIPWRCDFTQRKLLAWYQRNGFTRRTKAGWVREPAKEKL